MSNLSAVRIWAAWGSPPDHQTLTFCAALPSLSQFAEELQDRRGLVHRVTPPSPDNRAYPTRLSVLFPSRALTQLNNDTATTRRHLAAWLEHYAADTDTEFVVYARHTAYPHAVPGDDPPATASTAVQRCYRGRLWTVPPEVLGQLNSAGNSLPSYLTLDFNVTGHGAYTSWDAVDLLTGWVTR